jgi:thiosulfate/3-mercaptopyruvate sulfurtransferase
LYWVFQAYQIPNVHLLNGGLPKWEAEGRTLEATPGIEVGKPEDYAVTLNKDLIRYYEQIIELETKIAAGESDTQILDARGPGSYKKGHITVAKSVPYISFVNEDNTVKNPEEIRAILAEKGVDVTKPIVSSCGWGITASFNFAALKHAGVGSVPLYDGSYTEYVSILYFHRNLEHKKGSPVMCP